MCSVNTLTLTGSVPPSLVSAADFFARLETAFLTMHRIVARYGIPRQLLYSCALMRRNLS